MATWGVVAVGIDGCKAGWIAVVLRDGRAAAHFLPTIEHLDAAIPDVSWVGIDIPIAVPEIGPRAAELAVRAVLGPRRSSLFITPPRAALAAVSHADATKIATELCGSGCSQQAYRLAAKIFEVQDWLPRAPGPVVEVHPELSFSVLLGAPATANKKTWAGMVERRDALLRVGIDLDAAPAEPGRHAAVDDMLDAGAAAWSAARAEQGVAIAFPDPPGAEVAIWA